MRAVLQRVTSGRVLVAGEVVGAIGQGFVALVGVTHSDTAAEADKLAHKTAHLRVFSDASGKMTLSPLDIGAGVLVVSQFTLYADTRRGRRPDFTQSAPPELAAPLIDRYISALRAAGVAHVAAGVFGAMMHVDIQNDGPVTILLDTADWAASP